MILGAWDTGGLVYHLLKDSSMADCDVTIDTIEGEEEDSIAEMSD